MKNAHPLDAQDGLVWAWLRRFWLLLWCLGLGLSHSAANAQTHVDAQNLKISRLGDGVYVSVDWQFDLPPTLEDALLKGVPLYFVTEAELTQERWYFYDKRIAAAERHVRVMYQPLTRRWRVSVLPHAFSGTGLGVSLGQAYASADEALQTVKRLTQWRIASASDLNADAKQHLVIKFKLDLTQLPRPLQMGALTQTEWDIHYTKSQRLMLESER